MTPPFHPVLRLAPSIATTKSWDQAEAQNRTELTEQPWQQQPGGAAGTSKQYVSIFTSSHIRPICDRIVEEQQIGDGEELERLL